MKFANVRELKNRTSELLKRAGREDVIITSRGKPIALILRIGEEDLEDYMFYSGPRIRREIERRWRRYLKEGKSVPIDELLEGRGKAGGRV
ncbi:MAG: type II toxin-antitoxin system Phd/YefM family antitoxin [Candidatus Methylomirabilales bacterium]